MQDVAIFLFGSPARYELLGESDADILIVRKKDTAEVRKFQMLFTQVMGEYGFVKIDIPTWGTIEDCRQYVMTAVTEGNQVLESRFLWGDVRVARAIEQLKIGFSTPEKMQRVLCFQYYYFNQYYVQRGREGVLNLKYGHGGTRDLLFPIWLSNLRDGVHYAQQPGRPAILQGLHSLLRHGDITQYEFERYKDAIGYVLFLRNEMLRINRGTQSEGLTFFDASTIRRLIKDKTVLIQFGLRNQEEFLQYTARCVKTVFVLKQHVWSIFHTWCRSNSVRKKHDMIRILTDIWTASNGSKFTARLLRMHAKSDSWEVLTSIACRRDCPPDVLNYLATQKGFRKGYEYVLKIIGRNRNTRKSTLERIARNSKIEMRFRLPAITHLTRGVKRANELM